MRYVVLSISFQTFFVQVFKIVVDSWKFSMLLLYILWDDRPIFMISASNQQLQPELESTILKPDCHSSWISKMQSGCGHILEERYAIKFCFKLERKDATETYGMLQTVFRPSCMNRTSVSEWHKRFKEGSESARDDERCKEVRTPELIGHRVRVRVSMLRFYGSSGRDSVGKGQHSSNQVIGISTRTIHQSTTLSLSQTIWPSWTSWQFLTLPIVQTLLPVTFGYSLSSEAVVMRQLRRWKRLWRRSLKRSHKRTSMGPSEVIGTVQQVPCSRRTLLLKGLEFHVCTINKSAHTRKVWKLV